MNADVQGYLAEVQRHLPKHVNHGEVIAELGAHLHEAALELQHEGMDSAAAVTTVLRQMGAPRKLARAYSSSRPLSAAGWSAALLLVNGLCFAAGAGLLMGQQGGSATAAYGFHVLAAGKEGVLLIYALVWLLSGYMLGRKHGAQAEKRIRRVITLPLLPNYLFMLLVLFRILPGHWFDSLLSMPFLLLCIGATLMFSRLARLGCRWGTYAALNG